jgi:hypothetical protein
MPDDPKSALPPGEYTILGGDAPDLKQASFRLRGDALDPEAITRATGLTPHQAHRKGDRRPSSERRRARGRPELPPWRSGLWSLHSERALPRTDNHLEDHVAWLLDQLEPLAEVLTQFRLDDDLTADFFCGYFMHQSNGGFEFSSRTLGRIVALGATLGVDIYGPDPDDEDRIEIVETGP